MSETTKTDIVIIGAGAAGMTAAVYAARGGNSAIVLEQNVHGGQIVNTGEVENYPAILSISGVEFAGNLYEQATSHGADIRYEKVTGFDFSGPVKVVETDEGRYECKAVILANGVVKRKLGVPGEEKFQGRGVSYCATCDGGFFRGKKTAVVGGGNTALEDALFLANLCEEVTLIHRRDEFRGDAHNVKAVLARENIRILYDTVPLEVLGDQQVTGLKVQNKKDGRRERTGGGRGLCGGGPDPAKRALSRGGRDGRGRLCRRRRGHQDQHPRRLCRGGHPPEAGAAAGDGGGRRRGGGCYGRQLYLLPLAHRINTGTSGPPGPLGTGRPLSIPQRERGGKQWRDLLIAGRTGMAGTERRAVAAPAFWRCCWPLP